MARTSPTRASFGARSRRWRRAQRQHQLALDAHKATRAGVTERVKQAHPELDETDLWQAVSQDAEERAAWKHRQKRRKVVARTHERARWKREDFAHQHSRRIVNEFDVIALEDLSVDEHGPERTPRQEHPRRRVEPVCGIDRL